jgi:hypothetical protein
LPLTGGGLVREAFLVKRSRAFRPDGRGLRENDSTALEEAHLLVPGRNGRCQGLTRNITAHLMSVIFQTKVGEKHGILP